MYSNPNLSLFLEVIRFAAFALCIIFNGMLLRMIFMNRHNDLGSYRFFLLAFVSADILHGLLHCLIVPVPETYKNAFIMGGHGTWSSRYGVGFLWPVAFSIAFPMLSFNFAYRLVAVKYPFRLDVFNTHAAIGIMAGIVAANAVAWSCLSRYMGFDDEQNLRYVNDFFLSNGSIPTYLNHDISEIDDYIVIDRGIFDGPRWKTVICSAIMGLLGDVAYKFMTYAAYNIVHCLRQNTQWSERYHRQNVQLFRALVLQAITPFITSYIPMGLCGFLPFLGVDFPLFSVLLPPLCALHSVFDAVIMLTTVSQFRSTLIEWLRCRRPRRNSKVIIIEHEDKHTSHEEYGHGKRRMTISPFD